MTPHDLPHICRYGRPELRCLIPLRGSFQGISRLSLPEGRPLCVWRDGQLILRKMVPVKADASAVPEKWTRAPTR
jgi:hypothetical protein